MKIFIDITDERNKYTFESLQNLGYQVAEYIQGEKMEENNILVFSPAKRFTLEEVVQLNNNITIFCGNVIDSIKEIFIDKNITHINFMNDEVFTIMNAHLTAEGVLPLIVNNTKKSIYDNNILVIGVGRVGKAIILLLTKLGLTFSTVSFSVESAEGATIFTKTAYYKDEYIEKIKDYDIVINTVPYELFGVDEIKKFSRDTLILEIASVNCINKNALLCSDATKLSLQYIIAPAIPSKVAPKSAGILMAESIIRNLKKVEKIE